MPATIPGVLTAENTRRKTALWKEWDTLANKEGPRKTMYWPGGEQYKGSWKNNKRHGKGALVYKNGTKYEGDWEEGMRHGMGSMWTFQDGKFKVTYNGQWSHDVPCGNGVFYDNMSKNVYDGEWQNGVRCGKGKMTYGGRPGDGFGGDVYEGWFLEDKRHGKGTMTYGNNNVYEGHWESDVRCGMGTLFFTDKGRRFDGLWKNDSPKAGSYSEIDVSPPGASGTLPILELHSPGAVLQDAVLASA